jgi:DNA-directed RNA polymerase sigma subunit (sigma70/sigma32)
MVAVSKRSTKASARMSFAEIGRELGISRQAARQLYKRAIWKLKMRRALKEHR